MSTRWSKFSLILACTFFFFSSVLKAEELGEIIYNQFSAARELVVTNIFKVYPHYANREIESISIFISPTELKASQISLKIGNNTQTLTLESYRPENVESFKSLTFSLPATLRLKQKDIERVAFKFTTEVAVSFVKVNYKGELSSDIEGTQFSVQLDRLEKLSKQNLYAEQNNRQEDETVRLLAAVELAGFPSLRAARILLERNNYNGVWVDWDLHTQSFKSLIVVLQKLINRFGEEAALYVMEKLYNEDEQYDVRNLVIDTIAEFKTSAAVMFLIKNHTYSSTSSGNDGHGILNAIHKKADLGFYLERYKPQLIELFKTGLGLPVDDGTFIFAKERACAAITASPVGGLFDSLWIEAKRPIYSLSTQCSFSLITIITRGNTDIASEGMPYQDEMIRIILDRQTPQRYYFSHMHGARRVAALMLGKFQTKKAQNALTQALTIPDLEDSVKADILEALSWYK